MFETRLPYRYSTYRPRFDAALKALCIARIQVVQSRTLFVLLVLPLVNEKLLCTAIFLVFILFCIHIFKTVLQFRLFIFYLPVI